MNCCFICQSPFISKINVFDSHCKYFTCSKFAHLDDMEIDDSMGLVHQFACEESLISHDKITNSIWSVDFTIFTSPHNFIDVIQSARDVTINFYSSEFPYDTDVFSLQKRIVIPDFTVLDFQPFNYETFIHKVNTYAIFG